MLHLNSYFNKTPTLTEWTYFLSINYLAPDGLLNISIIVFLVIKKSLSVFVKNSGNNTTHSGFLKSPKSFLSLGKFGKPHSDTQEKIAKTVESNLESERNTLSSSHHYSPKHIPSFSFAILVNNTWAIQHFTRVRNLLVCNLAKSKNSISEHFSWEHKISGYTFMCQLMLISCFKIAVFNKNISPLCQNNLCKCSTATKTMLKIWKLEF